MTVIAVVITITACSPGTIVVLDKTIVDYKGINPIVTALLVLLILFFELIAYALVSMPLTASMDMECDPQKHLILNTVLNKQKKKDYIYAADYFYMGNFEEALNYANKMVAGNKQETVITGLFNKARCEFFLGDFESLKATVKQYENVLNNFKKGNKKTKDAGNKILKTMNLLVAISEEDKQGMSNFGNIEAWNNSKATQGYINYLKGMVAYMLEDKKEAIYRFMYVKENYEKTVFSKKSQEYLLKIGDDI
ncbi:MAG: hypothetical protein J6I80_04860 [Clostridia bacterium]|nr:hypothetical protein [Clostridia bacterium]